MPSKPFTTRRCAGHLAAGLLLALGLATAQAAQAAPGKARADADGSYARERAVCLSGQSQQDRNTCLTEARNAAAEQRRGSLGNSNDDFAANAMARCEVFRDSDDKAACQARMQGRGTVTGSVAAGGVLREVETAITH